VEEHGVGLLPSFARVVLVDAWPRPGSLYRAQQETRGFMHRTIIALSPSDHGTKEIRAGEFALVIGPARNGRWITCLYLGTIWEIHYKDLVEVKSFERRL
jgi:hypothetical protein